jgi:hypothetical protein
MSFDKAPKSDRFQIMTAVLFMGLFAAVFLIITLPKDSITSFVCNYTRDYAAFTRMCSGVPSQTPEASGELISATIASACVDLQGLKISVLIDEPLAGAANIQVFSTGPDFFPSERGMTDTYEISQPITTAVDHLDLVIPVDSMPIGEKIFGNIAVSGEGVYSQTAYSIMVSDCSTTNTLPPNPTDNIPSIQSTTCLPSGQLMIAFEFEGPVLGQYRVLVDDVPYQLASVIHQPATLFFSGVRPPEEPVEIRLISATDEVTLFQETYSPPLCGGT